jgi:hypothetical protein
MRKENIKTEMFRVSKSSHSLPKHCGIVAMLSDRLSKVSMGKTAKCGPDAKYGMRSLPREYIHNTQDVLSFE